MSRYFNVHYFNLSIIQLYKQPTRCNNNNLLVISINSTYFGR